jgi:hypothetical protein
MLISKTIFQHCLHCPKDAWLKLHKPELRGQFVFSEFELHLMEQGNEVESYARNLFPGGIEVSTTGEHAVEDTTRLMTERMAVIFQATFIVDNVQVLSLSQNKHLIYLGIDGQSLSFLSLARLPRIEAISDWFLYCFHTYEHAANGYEV